MLYIYSETSVQYTLSDNALRSTFFFCWAWTFCDGSSTENLLDATLSDIVYWSDKSCGKCVLWPPYSAINPCSNINVLCCRALVLLLQRSSSGVVPSRHDTDTSSGILSLSASFRACPGFCSGLFRFLVQLNMYIGVLHSVSSSPCWQEDIPSTLQWHVLHTVLKIGKTVLGFLIKYVPAEFSPVILCSYTSPKPY